MDAKTFVLASTPTQMMCICLCPRGTGIFYLLKYAILWKKYEYDPVCVRDNGVHSLDHL